MPVRNLADRRAAGPALDRIWFTRCPVPTASGVAHALGWLQAEFGRDGLEVAALNGEPGVKSARCAGEGRSFDQNIEKLLTNLAGKADRSARFRTVISLLIDGKETLFEGICEGRITGERKDGQGFGYDPVFVPDGSDLSFAEMSMEEKAKFSHRRKATDKLVAFLNNLKINN